SPRTEASLFRFADYTRPTGFLSRAVTEWECLSCGYTFCMEPILASDRLCPRCGSRHRQVKIGTTHKGKQRFRCRDCGRRYGQNPTPKGYEPALRQQAIRLYLEQNGFRRIGRLLGVNPQTVANWVKAEEARQPPAPQPASTEIVEMDELYALHQKKGTISSSP